MAAAVADRDHDEADLGEAVRAHHALGPGDVVRLDLRAGIDIVNNRIHARGIEVEGLVHRAVEVRDPVGRLDLEALRHLVAGGEQQAQVGLVEKLALAVAPDQPGLGGVVHAGAVAHQIAAVVAGRGLHVHVIHVQLADGSARERDAPGVHLVRILVLVHAAGGEEHVALLLVHRQDVLDVVGAFGEVAHQGAVRIIEIEVGPAVALGPPEELLSAAQQVDLPVLDVGIHALGDEGAGGVGGQVHAAHVHAVQVAGAADQVEAVVVAQPHAGAVLVIGLAEFARARGDVEGLVLEGVDLITLAAPVGHGEDVELLRGARFAGHLVFVGLEGGARLAQGVDHPEVLDLTHIGLDRGEVLAVRRPDDPARHHAAGGVGLRVAGIIIHPEAPLAHAV